MFEENLDIARCTTIEFAKLRAFVRKNVEIVELAHLRDTILQLVELADGCLVENNPERFCSIGYELWDALSKAPHPYHLPRKYVGQDIERIMTYVFRCLYALESKGLGEGGNIALNGLKGVGKTTVLRVAGSVAALLTKSVIPVYWIYESSHPDLVTVRTKRLAHAARSTFERVDIGDDERTFEEIVLDTHMEGLSPFGPPKEKYLYLLDEFTNLYSFKTEGLQVIEEYRRFARNGNVLFVLAASRINVKKYIFPVGSSQTMYPNLNCGLFSVEEVRPIRDLECFIDYWEKRFGERLDNVAALAAYKQTGGVGRFILQLKSRGEVSFYQDVKQLLQDPNTFHLACSILKSPMSVAYALQRFSVELVDHLVDSLLLYNDGEAIDFLLGSVKERFKDHISREIDLHQAHIFHCQRTGFVGGSTGHSNEDFVCRYIWKLFDLSPLDPLLMELDTENLLFSDDNKSQISLQGSVAEMDEFLSSNSARLVRWKAETGIDRIWWKWDSGARTLIVSGLQVKTGRDDVIITCGVLSTQRAKSKASLCEDKYIAGILSKAERGLSLVAKAMHRKFGCAVVFDTVYICTNKQAEDQFNKFFQTEMQSPDHIFIIDPSLVHPEVVEANSFSCVLYDKTDWLKDVFPSDLYNFL